MRILLAEDESDIGSAIEKSLHHHKYVVDWVRDGNEAWNYLVDFQSIYTLAILDWMLPGLSGIELCQRLRQQANPLPVLILTARDSMADKVTGLDAGADDYLVKPFELRELHNLHRLDSRRHRTHPSHPTHRQGISVARVFHAASPAGFVRASNSRSPLGSQSRSL
jgi:DNA-binding response OmpR family regulator